MDYNLAKKSAENAISRGDVETLVVLYYQYSKLHKLINKGIPELAQLTNLPTNGYTTFKEWVMNVYDPEQARKAYNSEDAVEYLNSGGITRARNMAKVLPEYYSLYSSEVLYHILAKLKGEYNEDVRIFVDTASNISDLLILGSKYNDFKPVEDFLKYKNPKRIPWIPETKEYVIWYVKKYYPMKGISVLADIAKYSFALSFAAIPIAVNIILQEPNFTDKAALADFIATDPSMERARDTINFFGSHIEDTEFLKMLEERTGESTKFTAYR